MENNKEILDELLKELIELPDNPTYDEVLEAAARVREKNHLSKKFMAKVDKEFYDSLRVKKEQP